MSHIQRALFFLFINSYFFFLAVHLLALKPKRDYEALPVHYYLWSSSAAFSSNSILPLPETYQSCFSDPLSCLQCLRHSRFHTHR
jgi:hypothetical protein